jgi:hypothetical protein
MPLVKFPTKAAVRHLFLSKWISKEKEKEKEKGENPWGVQNPYLFALPLIGMRVHI